MHEVHARRAKVKGQPRTSCGMRACTKPEVLYKWRASVLELSEVLIGSGGSRTVARAT